MAATKKENTLEDVALAAGIQQNLSNLYSVDIYEPSWPTWWSSFGMLVVFLAANIVNGTARFKRCKQLFEYQYLLLLEDIWW